MTKTKSKNKKVKCAQDNSGKNTWRRSRGNHFTDSFGGTIYYKSKRNDRAGKKKGK